MRQYSRVPALRRCR